MILVLIFATQPISSSLVQTLLPLFFTQGSAHNLKPNDVREPLSLVQN